MEYVCNRLLVVGSKPMFSRFASSNWERILGAKFCEPVRNSPRQYVVAFNTEQAPIVEPLKKLSRLWPKLIFLLDWEWEDKRLKGFVHAKTGSIDSYQLEY